MNVPMIIKGIVFAGVFGVAFDVVVAKMAMLVLDTPLVYNEQLKSCSKNETSPRLTLSINDENSSSKQSERSDSPTLL